MVFGGESREGQGREAKRVEAAVVLVGAGGALGPLPLYLSLVVGSPKRIQVRRTSRSDAAALA